MKTIYNSILPMRGFTVTCIYTLIFVRNDQRQRFTATVKNHETIHAYQQIELCVLSLLVALLLAAVGLISYWWLLASPLVYFALYLIEWFIIFFFGLFFHKPKSAYKQISFEQEAYYNEHNMEYLDHRKPFAWVKYLF